MFRLHELKLEGSQIQITDAPSSWQTRYYIV
jgi:hypothetical protein